MGRSLDVVGAAEAAQILGVEVPRISRWRGTDDKPGRMPPTVADLAATPVWRRKDIEQLRDKGTWKGRTPAKMTLLGLSEAAAVIGVDKSQIGRWRRDGKFPPPTLEKRGLSEPWEPGAGLSATPLWTQDVVLRWKQSRNGGQS